MSRQGITDAIVCRTHADKAKADSCACCNVPVGATPIGDGTNIRLTVKGRQTSRELMTLAPAMKKNYHQTDATIWSCNSIIEPNRQSQLHLSTIAARG